MEFKKVKAKAIKGKKVVKGKKYEFTYYVIPMLMYVRKHVIESVGDEFIVERDHDRGIVLVYPAGGEVKLRVEVIQCPERGIVEHIRLAGDGVEGITFKKGRKCMKVSLVFTGTLREASTYAKVLRDIIEHAVGDLIKVKDSLLSLARTVFGEECKADYETDVIHIIKVVKNE